MLDTLFTGIFANGTVTTLSIGSFLCCLLIAAIIGLILSFSYCFKSRYTKSFVVTLATLPAVVAVVIMMVNGNLGAGVAVAGTFSLVRFRSVPGTAREIGAIFLAMGAGLAVGMGYLAYALLFVLIMGGMGMVYNCSSFGESKKFALEKILRITIPEDLDYSGVFDDLFQKYATYFSITEVKTSGMGSLYKLTYRLTLKNNRSEKELLDQLRCRNGNLEISVSRQESAYCEL